MGRFLLGVLVGGFATATLLGGPSRSRAGGSRTSELTVGRVDELSSATNNPETAPLNAGDGTPGLSASGMPADPLMPPRTTRH